MSLREQWLAEPTALSFAEWRRLQTVPAGLRDLPPVVIPPRPTAKAKPATSPPVRPEKPPAVPAPRPAPRELVHGTSWGARRHMARGEEVCEPCAAALREYRRKHSAAARLRKRGAAKELLPCGTKAAAVRHRKAREPMDEACLAAERAEWHARKKASAS